MEAAKKKNVKETDFEVRVRRTPSSSTPIALKEETCLSLSAVLETWVIQLPHGIHGFIADSTCQILTPYLGQIKKSLTP